MKWLDISTKRHPNVFAMVDDEDFEMLSKWKWHGHWTSRVHTAYAVRSVGDKKILMHRFIMKTLKGEVCDHWDGNGLNDQKKNLRSDVKNKNAWNRNKTRADTTSTYIGVFRQKQTGKWEARICVNGESIYLGAHESEHEAAKARDDASIKYYGEFAKLNF